LPLKAAIVDLGFGLLVNLRRIYHRTNV